MREPAPLEAEIQRDILLAAPTIDCILMRNVVGRFLNPQGNSLAVGLGGEGGSDLIGWAKLNGAAVFLAIECKRRGARTPPERLKKQLAFIAAVRDAGGIAAMCFSVEEFIGVVRDYRARADESGVAQ